MNEVFEVSVSSMNYFTAFYDWQFLETFQDDYAFLKWLLALVFHKYYLLIVYPF